MNLEYNFFIFSYANYWLESFNIMIEVYLIFLYEGYKK
jgi:hypothetical protein